MMNTPIYDFCRRYADSHAVRLHMPGHKGIKALGCEHLDLTEIEGADSLFEADGIIRESEHNAGNLFGCNTFYSTEGSSLCIRAMLYLASLYAKEKGESPTILSGRNAHKTFISACALIDFQVEWIYPEEGESYLSCTISPERLDRILAASKTKPTAVYVTSPDYLGNTQNIRELSQVCRKYGILLLVDNAHGAYLRFLENSQHPMDLGADMCCDSAHKTLPVLTGGAYLHINKEAPAFLSERAKLALSLFASTSPSYLILQSLDLANRYINEGYTGALNTFILRVNELKTTLCDYGYNLSDNEPLKVTISPGNFGYTGCELSKILANKNVFCEFADPDFIVFMLTQENTQEELARLSKALCNIPRRSPVLAKSPSFHIPERVMSPREAVFAQSEVISAKDSEGRILASANVGCPPAVPLIACGEKIDQNTIKLFEYYNINNCIVTK